MTDAVLRADPRMRAHATVSPPPLSVRQTSLAAALFFAAIAAALAAGKGAHLIYVYPIVASALGLWLFFRSPLDYLGFTLVLWFATPLVRRLVDYQSGWHPINPVMLAPLLVTGLSALTAVEYAGSLTRRKCFPFLLCFAACLYAFLVGTIRNGFAPALYELLSWAVPIAFGLHFAIEAERYAAYRAQIARTLLYGACAMGLYGIAQFYLVPPWDAFWMMSADINSVGEPRPFLVRVFSTMNSPGVLAPFLLAGLLLPKTGWRSVAASLPALAALLLSLVRASWIGLAGGIVVLLLGLRGRDRLKLVLVLALVPLAALPILLSPPISDAVSTRFATFTDLHDDTSYGARSRLYETFLDEAVSEVAGQGFGNTGLATKLANGGFMGEYGNLDSGILELGFVLGWPGAALFLWGLGSVLRWTISSGTTRSDPFATSAGAIVFALIIQLAAGNTLVGPVGALFWMFAGLKLAARAGAGAPQALPSPGGAR